MIQDEIIEMARQYGIIAVHTEGDGNWHQQFVALKAFAKLVTEKEREKSLKLWMLLDDIDTADDIAKSDNDIYRSLCRKLHKKRWYVLNQDEIDEAIRARGNV